MSARPLVLFQATAGIAGLCALDAAMKHVMQSTPVGPATLGRYIAGTIMAFAVWRATGAATVTRAMLPAQFARGALITVTALLFFYALTQLPLAEVMVLAFTAPLMIPPLAALLLGEPMRGRTLVALGIGFAGVIVTVQGTPLFTGGRLPGVAAALASSLTYALSAIILRARAGKDGAVITTLLGAAIPMVLCAPFAVGAAMPGWADIGWLVLAGLFGNLGIQLLARAYAQAEAQTLSVLEFTGLIWAALFGWLFFGEAVRPQVWAGAAIIVCAVAWASRQQVDAMVKEPFAA